MLAERYLYGPGESGDGGIAEIEAMYDLGIGKTIWFHQDQLGSVRHTTMDGNERTYQAFDAYGNLLGSPDDFASATPPQLTDEFKKASVQLGSSSATSSANADEDSEPNPLERKE